MAHPLNLFDDTFRSGLLGGLLLGARFDGGLRGERLDRLPELGAAPFDLLAQCLGAGGGGLDAGRLSAAAGAQ